MIISSMLRFAWWLASARAGVRLRRLPGRGRVGGHAQDGGGGAIGFLFVAVIGLANGELGLQQVADGPVANFLL